MKYDVAVHVATVDWIMNAFPADPGSTAPDANEEAPIFIVGPPRNGTTLVERIMGNLLEFYGLDWDDGCIDFHHNLATASASQVRRPLYGSSVSQWRHYEQQFTEPRDPIVSAGIEV